jgi:hypothetical protein
VDVDDRNFTLVADADFHGIVVVSHVCVSFGSNLHKTSPLQPTPMAHATLGQFRGWRHIIRCWGYETR